MPEQTLVVIGLGYVGQPLACEAARAGWRVRGLDNDAGVVARLRAVPTGSSSPVDGRPPGWRAGFEATTDPAVLDDADVAVICVPTPLTEGGEPDLGAVLAAAHTVARHLHPGMLVVLESTCSPGTTEEVMKPLLEADGLKAGIDFHLAFSPERIDPGNPDFGLRNTPKVVGGTTAECADRAVAFYGTFVDTVVRARGTHEAEMAKLLENTYRHVNIALVNEMAKFCHDLDIDLWDVIRCAETKPFGFEAFRPGPGVGGHCIPVDPHYLSHRVSTMLGYPFRLVELAEEVNASMPGHVVDRVRSLLDDQGRGLRGATVLLLGVTYKNDVADRRETPAEPVARLLLAAGAQVSYADPFTAAWSADGVPVRRCTDLDAELACADVTVLLQAHSAFDLPHIARSARCVFDTRGVMTPSEGVSRL